MLRLRVLIAACGLASALALIPQANADQVPVNGYVTRQSEHFLIHFDGDPTARTFYPEAKAGDMLGWAEHAYARYQAMGYAAPLDDGDGLIDLWIDDLNLGLPFDRYEGFVTPLTPAMLQSAGTIHLDVQRGTNAHAVAHELFLLFQWRIFVQSESWLEESSAEWAAFQVGSAGAPTEDSLGEPDRSLDCIGFECGYSRAEDAPLYDEFYDQNANPGWSFFQYLAEKYGRDIVRDVWNRAAADGSGVAATTVIDQVLATKGSSLSNAFNDWINHRISGDFVLTALRGVLPQVWGSLSTGTTTGALPQQIVAVNRLAARYLTLLPGDDATSGPCYAATLSLQVTIPSGISSAPYVFVNKIGGVAQALTVSGSTASIKLPWNTCTGGAQAYLSLPNATTSANANGKEFTVGGTMTVDTKTIAAPTPAPAPVNISGAVGVVPTGAVAPAIEVSGPELIRLSAKATVLRLIVTADTDGRLQATLGSYTLGTVALRAGGNDLRFQLPASLRLRLRTQAAASNVLTLTSLSASGAGGQVVKRRVAIEGKTASKRKTKQKHR